MNIYKYTIINLSRQIISLLLFLVLGIVINFLSSYPPPANAIITIGEEQSLGKEIFKKVSVNIKLIRDPDCLAYLKNLGARLVNEIKDNPFTYRFYLVDSSEINAFAIPGAYIIFNRGIINVLENEEELAAVLSHEISHISLRHIALRIEKITPLSIAVLSGNLLSIIALASGIGALGQAIMIGSIAGSMQNLLSFSREDESQADYNGYQLLIKSGYPGSAMAQAFYRIWAQERLIGSSLPNHLRTHLSSLERIENIENMIRCNPQLIYNYYDNQDFLRIRTRLNALYEPIEEITRRLQIMHAENPREPLTIYGLAILYIRIGRYDLALSHLDVLCQLWPNDPFVWREQAKCYLLSGEYSKAQRLYNQSILLQPYNQEALSGLAQTYLRIEQLEPAQLTLERLLTLDPNNEQYLYDLGIVLAKQGHIAKSSLYLGQAFLRRGNENVARYHLTQAKKGLTEQPELLKIAYAELENLNKLKN